MSKPKVFVREATGLVRDLTALDAFIIAVGISDIPFGGAAGYGFFGYLYPVQIQLLHSLQH